MKFWLYHWGLDPCFKLNGWGQTPKKCQQAFISDGLLFVTLARKPCVMEGVSVFSHSFEKTSLGLWESVHSSWSQDCVDKEMKDALESWTRYESPFWSQLCEDSCFPDISASKWASPCVNAYRGRGVYIKENQAGIHKRCFLFSPLASVEMVLVDHVACGVLCYI